MDLVSLPPSLSPNINFILPLDPSSLPSLHVNLTFIGVKTQLIDTTYTIVKWDVRDHFRHLIFKSFSML